MKYLALVGSDGPQPEAAVAQMNRDWPDYAAEMDRRHLWRIGGELEFPETAVAVRVRGGETFNEGYSASSGRPDPRPTV
ncbi:MAG: hypothetical protein J2P23_00105 [Microlunatus sp.]|nr:hypothetical protein [Microlunatus sp.]